MSTRAEVLYRYGGAHDRRVGARALRAVVPVLLPFLTFGIQLALWRYLQPYAWVLFYPAVIASSWIGGVRHGLVATAVSTALVWWFFVPPERELMKDPDRLIPASVYIGLGVLTSYTHAHVRRANERIRKANEERRVFAALIENSSDFISIADAHGNAKYLNPGGRRLIGMTADQPLSNAKIPDFYPPELRSTIERVIEEMPQHDPWRADTYLRSWTSGEPIPVSQVRFTIRDLETGQVLGLGSIARDISERIRLDHALRDTSADLARAQSVAGVGSWRLDVRRNELVWSEESYRIFGVAPGTPLTYETFLACVHPDDRAYVDEKWKAALAGAPYDIEHRILVDGETRWVREKAELAFENGTLVGGIGIVQDLTARKRLEEELRLSEAKASGIVSISADAIISIDEQQRITLFNEGAERIFGYSKAEAIGAPLDVLIPDRLRARHHAYVEQFARGDEVSRHMTDRTSPTIGLRKNGEEFPVDASISKLEVGGTRILTVSLRDVTQEKRVETEQRFLAEVGAVLGSTLDYEKTLTNIVDLAVRDLADYCVVDLLDATGEVHRFRVGARDRANDWICDVLVRARIDRKQPYLTGPVIETLKPALMSEISPEVLDSFARSEEHLKALRAMNPGSAVLAPLLAGGRLLGAIGVIATASSRRYDARDVALVEELARRAALSVENARLYDAARHAIASRDDVMGIVAHDLRNPLNTIGLQAALLGREETAKEAATTIVRAVKRMNRLIQDLLDVTQMEGSRLPLERITLSSGGLVRDVVAAQRLLAVPAGIELVAAVERDVPDVFVDRDRVFRVFENLIGNAIKFTERGGKITVAAEPAEEDQVLFSVTDTGAGIGPEEQRHVFDRFWQGRKARRHGAGLGLPIVKGIIEAHGGRIWLESTLGRGTTFFFTIPRAPA